MSWISLPSYAKLRSYTLYQDDTVVFVLGGDTRSDGGEGIFYFDTSSTDTDDDATILRPSGVSVSNAGRWKRMQYA